MKSECSKRYGEENLNDCRKDLTFLMINSLTRVLKLEKELLQMRSTLDRGGIDQPTERTPGSLSKTLPVSQEDLNRQVCYLYVLCCK